MPQRVQDCQRRDDDLPRREPRQLRVESPEVQEPRSSRRGEGDPRDPEQQDEEDLVAAGSDQ